MRSRYTCEEPSLAALRRRQLKDRAVAYKGGKCMKCGGVYPSYIYDFHHRDPSTKCAAITANGLLRHAWGTVMDELDKCDLVCANCHRMIEHGD